MGKEGEREREQIEREGMRRLRIGKKIDRFSLTGAADDKFAARYVSVCLREIVSLSFVRELSSHHEHFSL